MAAFWEKIQVDRQDMEVYASVPSGSGPFPAIIVCVHGGGVDEFIRTICDRFAEAGYAGVAPDLFHRFTEEMVQSSGKTRRELLSDPQTIADINATVGWLRNHAAIELGGSPRAGIALIKASRARALIHGRGYVIPEDLFALAEDAVLHRLRLRYEALADGLTGKQVLEEMLRDMGSSTAGAGQSASQNGSGSPQQVSPESGQSPPDSSQSSTESSQATSAP